MTYYPLIDQSRLKKEYGVYVSPNNNTEIYNDINNTWGVRKTLPSCGAYASSFVMNGYGYVVGGNTGAAISNENYRYDISTDIWTVRTVLTTARADTGAFEIVNKGYIVGGITTTGGAKSAINESYSDITNTWISRTSLSSDMSTQGTKINNYGYIIGGTISVTNQTLTQKYDDETNAWTTQANLNTAKNGTSPSCFELNGYGYIVCQIGNPVDGVTEKYDDINNTWTVKGSLNTNKSNISTFSMNGFGYEMGGIVSGGANSAITEQYNEIANTWTAKASIGTATSSGTGFSISLKNSYVNTDISNVYRQLKRQIPSIIEVATVLMSFETGEQTATTIYFPYKVTINNIKGIVMKAIAATDNGTITGANSTGDSANGVITATASDALNTEYSVSPTTNNTVAANSYYKLTSAKTTAGGKVLVTLKYTRI